MSITEHEYYYQRWYRAVWDTVPMTKIPDAELLMEKVWELGYRTKESAVEFLRERLGGRLC